MKLAVLLLALLTAACAPAKLEFLRPSAPGGNIVRSGCPPAQRYLLLEKGGVTIGVTIGEHSTRMLTGRLAFGVPEGKVVRLAEQAVEVSARARGAWVGRLEPGFMWPPGSFQPRDAQPTEPLPGVTRHGRAWWPFSASPAPWGHSRHAYYSFGFSVSLADAETPETFDLKLPAVSVNGIMVELPPITFIQDQEFAFVGLNC